MATILVIEDEISLAEIIQFRLQQEGYQVYLAYDGEEGIKLTSELEPDLLLLDLMLPKKDGFEVCKEVRKFSNVPIIMLTAKDSEVDKIIGLELGADDYVTKPFSNRELIARVKANLRRHLMEQTNQAAMAQGIIQVGGLVINYNTYQVSKNGQPLNLTHREFELLYYLARNLGQVLTREHLLQEVWGYDYLGDVRTVDVSMRRLREKIEEDPSNPSYIITRRGMGYILQNPLKEGKV